MTTFDQMKDIIIECTGVDGGLVKPEAKFIDDIGLDSLDIVEIILAAEEWFGVNISDEVLEAIVTVQDAIDAVDHATSDTGVSA